jgi:glycosyltransferase involved in cell wall biosynthesis
MVSVVVPTYNRRELVVEAVESILAQDWPRIETIVVDDGSTDGTAEHLRREYGDRIQLLVQKNSGVSVARNTGLAAAKGEFLALLDSDDLLAPGSIRSRAEMLLKHPEAGAVFGAHQRQTSQGTWEGVPLPPSSKIPTQREELLRQFAVKPFFFCMDLLFRRELLPANGRLFEPDLAGFHEDYLMILCLLAKTPCVPCNAIAHRHRNVAGQGRIRYAHEWMLQKDLEPLDRFFRESEAAALLKPIERIIRAHFLISFAKAARKLGYGRLYRSYARRARSEYAPLASGFQYWRRYLQSYLQFRRGAPQVMLV